ncbi:hypothetical protein [Amycolatopsis samaneae]|uniref:Uncharacterized protein n=1 Tax=Amycolatopsis samaneae TaxID=664691 RepID=A0ABW5GP61_9PSEU
MSWRPRWCSIGARYCWGKLLAGGHAVAAEVYAIDDPIARFAAMERIRGTDRSCAAPWSEVLSRLGLQLSPRKARELVRAFAEMPREVCEEMDEAKISLHTRIRYVELHRGRAQAAADIWAAVKDTGQTRLLTTHAIYPPRWQVEASTARILGVPDTTMTVLFGYGEDPLVERFWAARHRDKLIDRIAALRFDLVLAPN